MSEISASDLSDSLPQGRSIRLAAIPTPTMEPLTTVTISGGLGGCFMFSKEMLVSDARAFAAEIEASCVIVENDR